MLSEDEMPAGGWKWMELHNNALRDIYRSGKFSTMMKAVVVQVARSGGTSKVQNKAIIQSSDGTYIFVAT